MINGIGFIHERIDFPVGEMHVRLKSWSTFDHVDIIFEFEKNEDVLELLLVCDALKRDHVVLDTIEMHYVPFGRHDRVAVPGESLSLAVFAKLINSCGAKCVNVTDPHSDVTTALIDNCVVREQYEVFRSCFRGTKDFYLISPDAGALKKINKLAAVVNCVGVVETEPFVAFDLMKGNQRATFDDMSDMAFRCKLEICQPLSVGPVL